MVLKKRSILFFLTILFLQSFAQEIHVKYNYVKSSINKVSENLFIRDNNVLSIQDSVDMNTQKVVSYDYYASKLNYDNNVKDILFTTNFKNTDYLVFDKVSKPVWVIDKNTSKKILEYTCVKATTNFRGSDITAYFAEELPYSAGPYKFYGLPGLILEIKEDNKNYNLWEAKEIILKVNPKINYLPQLREFPKKTMKEFIEMKEKTKNEDSVNVEILKNRSGIEKKFEWEL